VLAIACRFLLLGIRPLTLSLQNRTGDIGSGHRAVRRRMSEDPKSGSGGESPALRRSHGPTTSDQMSLDEADPGDSASTATSPSMRKKEKGEKGENRENCLIM